MPKKFSKKSLRYLIAYGPTREPLDPVRYLSNYSTGTMGRCLVQAAKASGGRVTAVECPKDAESARDLLKKLKALLPKNDILIMNAAVADVRPQKQNSTKIKKDNLSALKLVKNPDILRELSKSKKSSQVFIGFGLESNKVKANGLKKLKQKKLELIVLQEVTAKNRPFGSVPVKALALCRSGSSHIINSTKKLDIAKYVIKQAQICSQNRLNSRD